MFIVAYLIETDGNVRHANDATVANQTTTVAAHATVSSVVVIVGFNTMFNRISHSAPGRVCGEGHPFLLIRG